MAGKRFSEISSRLTDYEDQTIFLRAVKKMTPEFWSDLRAMVLPHFPANISPHAMKKGYRGPAFSTMAPYFLSWLERYHIETVDWLHAEALVTLRAWNDNPKMQSYVRTAPSTWLPAVPVFEGPQTLIETRAVFVQRANEYFQSVKEQEIISGMAEPPERLADNHAEWLALRQFTELSISEIAKKTKTPQPKNDPDFNTLRRQIVNTAKRLHILLRSHPPGPKKRK